MQRKTTAVKLTDGLFLVQIELDKSGQKVKTVAKPLNHIFMYDRSGSMYGSLSTLCSDLKKRYRQVPKGDTVTIGWFSGQGQFRFVLKGLVIDGDKSFATLDKVIDANSNTIGMTCFSEILKDTEEVIRDLAAHSDSFAVCFLTDGYPTTYPYEKEIAAINAAIDKIAGKVASSLLVGYSDYYNKELLAAMAKRFGGALIHSSDLRTFPIAYADFMEKSRDSEGRIEVDVSYIDYVEATFSLGSGGVNLYEVTRGGTISFAPSKADVDRIYQIIKADGCTPLGNPEDESFLKGRYAAALVMTQKCQTDKAVEILGGLGDVVLIDRANNAFTNSEYGAAEQGMLAAIGKTSARCVGGCNKRYLPKSDAFCLVDALDLLMQDEDCSFLPYHDAFDYKRIGPPAKTEEGYPKFEADKDVKAPMTGLTWNQDKLNLSIRAKIPGTIDLGPEAKALKLKREFATFIWRNYAVVKDGFCNVPKLPVVLGKDTYDFLVKEGVIDKGGRHSKKTVYTLHLDRIPVMNRKMAEGLTSAGALCTFRWNELTTMADLKVLNYLRNQIEPKSERGLERDDLTPAQEAFLQSKGVTRSGFNPPTIKQPPTDFYMAKCFDIVVKGFSSLPKVDEVAEKMAKLKAGEKGARPLTPSQELIADALNRFGNIPGSAKQKLAKLDVCIEGAKSLQTTTRVFIQRTKFAVLLGKKWFAEFTSRENNVLKLKMDGAEREFVFAITEEKVEF